MNKLMSGRWILTIICGGVFLHAAMTKQLSPEAVGIIITMVFKDYFGKDDTKNQQEVTK
jgi:hypothetical protein